MIHASGALQDDFKRSRPGSTGSAENSPAAAGLWYDAAMPSAEGGSDRQYDRTGRVFLIGALGVALYFAWKIFQPFFAALAIAAIIDIVFYPLYSRLKHRFGGRRGPAAGLTVLVVVLCVILPVFGIGFLFTKQAIDLYQGLSAKAQDGGLESILRFRSWDAVESWLGLHAPWLDTQALNLKEVFLNFLRKVSGYGIAFGTAAASNVLSAAGTFAVVLFSLFFILLDGAAFAEWAWKLAPLTVEHRRVLSRTFIQIIKSAVFGSGVVGLVQGILGGLAFWIVGLPGVLWGSVMLFTSLVPVVGTALIWVPAGGLLLIQGQTGAGMFILAFGALIISNSDNAIRLFVVRGPVRMHPLLLFFAIMGGLKLAGLMGVVYGPLVLAMVQALLEIFRGEFLGRPLDPGEPAPPAGP